MPIIDTPLSLSLYNPSRLLLAASEFAVGTEYVHNLVDVHLLHILTSWLQILTWVEITWMLSEVLAHSCRHGKT